MRDKQASFGEETASCGVFASLYSDKIQRDTTGDIQFCSEDRHSKGRPMYLLFPLQSLQRHSKVRAALPMKKQAKGECFAYWVPS